MSDIKEQLSGFIGYLNGILRSFSSAGLDQQAAVGSMLAGVLLIMVSIILFIVL